MRVKTYCMKNWGEDIKIGNIIFKDVTVYSQNDKIRDKRSYEAEIKGLHIRVTNRKYDTKMSYHCDGIGKGRIFKDVNISFEDACKLAVSSIKNELDLIIKSFNI